MTYQRVVASSLSIDITKDGYTQKLIDNPICARYSIQLPRIYGKRWTARRINRLNTEEIAIIQSDKAQRQAEYIKHKVRKRLKMLEGSWLKQNNSEQIVHKAHKIKNSRVSINEGGNFSSIQLPRLRQSFQITRRPNLSISKQKNKVHSAFEKVTESFSLKKSGETDPLQKQSQMRTTRFSLLLRRCQQNRNQSSEFNTIKQNFSVPKKKDLPDVIQTYVPMDAAFDLLEILDSQTFGIIETQKAMYVGQIEKNRPHGFGLLFSYKSLFQGIFQEGHKKKGIEKCINGVYSGDYKNDMRDGYGKFQWNNRELYEGYWMEGNKQGMGKWTNGKGSSYQGSWSKNKQEGQGRFCHKDDVYVGEFVDFLKEGEGQEWFVNGDHYKGQYKSGKPYGRGIYTWKDGKVLAGTFVEGHCVNQTNYHDKSKTQKVTTKQQQQSPTNKINHEGKVTQHKFFHQ